jgi:hypothetical protein
MILLLLLLLCLCFLTALVRCQTTVFPACDVLLGLCQDPVDECFAERPFCNCTRKLSCFYGRCQGNTSQLSAMRLSVERQCRTVHNCSTCDLHLRQFEKFQPPNYEAILLALFTAAVVLVLLRAIVNFFSSVSESRSRDAAPDGPPPLIVIHAAPDQQNRQQNANNNNNNDNNNDNNSDNDDDNDRNGFGRRNSHPLLHLPPPVANPIPREEVESSSDSHSR